MLTPLRTLPARLLAALAFAGLGALVHAQGETPVLVPLNAFFDSQSIRQMVLSPDGNKVAMIAPNKGRYSLAVLDTTNGQVSVVVHFKDENIRSVFWKGNDRLIFTSAVEGHEIPLLASTDLAGKSVKRILEPRRTKDDFSIFFGNLVDRYPASDDHILITGFTGESDGRKINPSIPRSITPFVYKVNVETGKRQQVIGLDRGVSAGYFDANAQQRVTTVEEDGKIWFRLREKNDRPLQNVASFDPLDVRWEVLGLLADGRTAYVVDATEQDRGILRTMDTTTGKLGEALLDPPEGEITGATFSPKRDRLLGVAVESDKLRFHWFDPKWKAVAQAIESQMKNAIVSIGSISDDEKRFLFRVSSDRDPGAYFLGDLRGEGLRVQPINAVRPAIKPELMSPMEPIKFTARDGMVIHGYLTKPRGFANNKTPLLVNPHGGPFGPRDSWGFNPEVQFLANRGYAVLQVNFRGSGGYGVAFTQAGFGEWGGKMQDDLTDAAKWVIAQGWADPERVGIIGASYGGYAALAGVTMTPELYKVGINYVGVSDLRLITRYDLGPRGSTKAFFERAVGKDPAFLAARSPAEHVAKIRVPTLHAYGRNDPRVEFVHWEVLERELKKHGKTYEILIEDAEGHGFEKEETASKYYSTVEDFLARYMPSDALKARVEIGPTKVLEMPAKTRTE